MEAIYLRFTQIAVGLQRVTVVKFRMNSVEVMNAVINEKLHQQLNCSHTTQHN